MIPGNLQTDAVLTRCKQKCWGKIVELSGYVSLRQPKIKGDTFKTCVSVQTTQFASVFSQEPQRIPNLTS